MIHAAKLPLITNQRLSEILSIQLALLEYASTNDAPSEDGCKSWFSRRESFRERAEAITSWVWRSAKRCEKLEEFAAGPQIEKDSLVRLWEAEAKRFFEPPQDTLRAFESSEASEWENAGADFMRRFYDDFRRSGFPFELFSNPDGKAFTARHFLEAFLWENGRLCVCPACEETGFYTIARDAIRSAIDHYLPKSFYPHLSCHPFNLIPLCPQCNSWVKGDRDPLARGDGSRRNLKDIWLPYREKGLCEKTFLEVQMVSEPNGARFGDLIPLPGESLRERIESLEAIYDLPGRWAQRTDEIGEKLFRRMRGYLRVFPEFGGHIALDEFSHYLDELICIMHDEDLGREPHVFPMIWWLVRLVNDELETSGKDQPEAGPLLDEINNWLSVQSEEMIKMQERGKAIRAKVNKTEA